METTKTTSAITSSRQSSDIAQIAHDFLPTIQVNMSLPDEKKEKQFAHLLAFSAHHDTTKLTMSVIPTEVAVTLVSFSADFSLSAEKLRKAKSIRSLIRLFGEQTVLNFLILIIKTFAQDIDVKHNLSPSATLNCAKILINHFYCESIEDVFIALQSSMISGKTLYNVFNPNTFFEIFNEHIANKSSVLEADHRATKNVNTVNDKPLASSFLINAWVYYHTNKDEEMIELVDHIKQLRKDWKEQEDVEMKEAIVRSGNKYKERLKEVLANRAKQIEDAFYGKIPNKELGARTMLYNYHWVRKLFFVPKEYEDKLVRQIKKSLFTETEKELINKSHPDYELFVNNIESEVINTNNQFELFVQYQLRISLFKSFMQKEDFWATINNEITAEIICRI